MKTDMRGREREKGRGNKVHRENTMDSTHNIFFYQWPSGIAIGGVVRKASTPYTILRPAITD